MANEIISYLEMCQREGASLQQGMNFFSDRPHSVVLMSIQANAPYRDRIQDDGETLLYEGHDAPRSRGGPNPKQTDQPAQTPSGSLTQNGRFHRAASEYKQGLRAPRIVRVYEKLRPGIWSYNGAFQLVDSRLEDDGIRKVFRFKLRAATEAQSDHVADAVLEHRRLIPAQVKMQVWKRDRGRCVQCGATDALHFDHILPFSKGGASVLVDNVQLLCARHNLSKGAKLL